MEEYEYVFRREYQPVKNALIELLNLVQDEIREYFRCQYHFVGSARWNAITRVIGGIRGYDFDVDLIVKSTEEFPAREFKNIVMNAINKYCIGFGYGYSESKKNVITIKHVDTWNSRIAYSCDLAIVNEYKDKSGNSRRRIVGLDKTSFALIWKDRSKGYDNQKEKVEQIKKVGMWKELKDLYLWKKNNNTEEKESRALFAEAVNEIIQKGGKDE